ncbi:MAG: DUF479 domain-containing protein [Reichenbachiella sp.]
MNYLAHLYLSFGEEPIIIGNFIADAVKGKKFNDYPTGIKNGILIHREIDFYTDTHEIVKIGKRRLSEYRHYSGVIMDVFYDHFLASNWSQYSEIPLKRFTTNHYTLLNNNHDVLPERMKHLLRYMEQGDWLFNYHNFEGIQFALSGMSQRTAFKSGMENAVKNLEKDYDLLQNEFHEFFDDITNHIHNFTDQIIAK